MSVPISNSSKNQINLPNSTPTQFNDDLLRLSWNLWPYILPNANNNNKLNSTTVQMQNFASQILQFPNSSSNQSSSDSKINQNSSNNYLTQLSIMATGTSNSGRLPIPLSALYCPNKTSNNPKLHQPPTICSKNQCRAILNPYCTIDIKSRQWICCFCKTSNLFNPSYNVYFETNQMPPEIQPQSTTIDYIFPSNHCSTIYFFLLDISVNNDNLESIKQSITMMINRLPENSLAAILTFGSIVRLHEIVECDNFYKINIFSGSKEVPHKLVKDFVENQILNKKKSSDISNSKSIREDLENDFFKKISAFSLEFANIIESIKSDAHSIPIDSRQKQCAGVALKFASDLLHEIYPNESCRIITFLGGPITYGPGAIATESKKNTLRQYMDINKGHSLAISSLKFFSKLGNDGAKRNHIFDIYSGHGDQVGIHELKYLTLLTGGEIVMSDNFASNLFKQSIIKSYNNDSLTIPNNITNPLFSNRSSGGQNFSTSAMVEVKMSPGLKIMGCIGPCQSMNIKSPFVSSINVGMCNTVRWRCNCLTNNTTLAFYFEGPSDTQTVDLICHKYSSLGFLQFITSSNSNHGNEKRLRITTTCRSWMDVTNGLKPLSAGFDQSCAMACVARFAIFTLDYEANPDASKWLDKCLIALVKQFATFSSGNASSLSLPENFQMFPQFMFHLRRSTLINNILCSPDESTFQRQLLLRSPLHDILTMIQPVLLSYSFSGFNPAVLDVTSIRPDNILVLDTYFVILVYYGQAISNWIHQNLHKTQQYRHIQDLMDFARNVALQRLNLRNPTPRFVTTFHDGSQARFLFSKVNPSNNSMNSNNAYNSSNNDQSVKSILTDDVSLQSFIESLKKIAVREDS